MSKGIFIKGTRLLMLSLFVPVIASGAVIFTNLHSFNFKIGDGAIPNAGLILSGNTLYGTARYGGVANSGTVFKLNTDGSGFTNLCSFDGEESFFPIASLVLSGNTLYGTTSDLDEGNAGAVFAINTNGMGLTNVYFFPVADPTGPSPQSELVLSGHTLYGTTYDGGDVGNGMVFAVNTDGGGFTNLHSFTVLSGFGSTNTDGAKPSAGLVLSDDKLYGVTTSGGMYGMGTAFALNTNGTGLINLHSFDGTNGSNPQASMILSGNTLYGMTPNGGSVGVGVIFKINTDGTGFTNLYNFDETNGSNPQASLVLAGNMLYGMTFVSGAFGSGTVFSINTNGANFTSLYNFSSLSSSATNSDGRWPISSLVFSDNTLYGTTSLGGVYGNGTVFALTISSTPTLLNMQLKDNNVILSWSDPTFSLFAAPSLSSNFTNVLGAISPYTNPITGSQKFFRLSH